MEDNTKKSASVASVKTQCGDSTVDPENIVVLYKTFSPKIELPSDSDHSDKEQMEAEQELEKVRSF